MRNDEASTYSCQAQAALSQQNYELAVSLYEQAIQEQPLVRSHYWCLGLALLLHGQTEEAQTIWLMALAEAELSQVDQWTTELIDVLEQEAQQQTQRQNFNLAWIIRCHINEIAPTLLENSLQILWLSICQERLTAEEIRDLGVVSALRAASVGTLNPDSLLYIFSKTLKVESDPIMVEMAAAILPHVPNGEDFVQVLMPGIAQISQERRIPELAADLIEVYLQRDPNHLELLGHLSAAYQYHGDYEKGIQVARRFLELAPTIAQKVMANYKLLRGLMAAGGHWPEALATMADHRDLLRQLFQVPLTSLNPEHTLRLVNSGYHLPYFQDDLPNNRSLQNQIIHLCQNNIRHKAADIVGHYQHVLSLRSKSTHKPLKIGYLSHCLGKHSVGWLARWLIQHHDRDQFQLHGYFYMNRENDPVFDWYCNQMTSFCRAGIECKPNIRSFAERIYEDEIDILIDLDSITLDMGCELLTVKPAPIQVTWLGWDASGMDTIDYFLADPYVLPENAQDHYVEKIWRLPQTYLAVDGFEVGVPTLRRDLLKIPNDAVIYLSAQTGYKRHPDTIRLQMQIIRQVPNSYFLIKGLGDQAAIQNVFIEIAEEEGVSCDRLRFLPMVDSEAIHRANLGIADIVLDTFPYNGATTTMETLWMGVPLVTRVGQQFASRNSYTMLKNAGIDEGIAWTDAEYVEWGVRLGQDSALREDIAWRLKRSRQTAPLWNGAAFTRDVEQAYQQMWAIYQENHRHVL